MASTWYLRRNGNEEGPLSSADLRAHVATGTIGPEDLIRNDGMADWVPVRSIGNLFPVAPSALGDGDTPTAEIIGVAVPSSHPGEAGINRSSADGSLGTSSHSPEIIAAFTAAAEMLRGEGALAIRPDIPPWKLQAIESYCTLEPQEQVLAVYDSTFFGVASEGITLTDRAITWAYPDGNRGRRDYRGIDLHALHVIGQTEPPAAICLLIDGGTATLPCKSLRAGTVEAMHRFIAKAARISQGLDVAKALPRAKALAAAGHGHEAVRVWDRLIADDSSVFQSVLADVEGLLAADSSADPRVRAYREALASKRASRDRHWLIERAGRAPDEVTAVELQRRWRAGTVRHTTLVKHLSDARWAGGDSAEPLRELPPVYVTDCGTLDAPAFEKCVSTIAAKGYPYERLRFFGPTSAVLEAESGKPQVYLGLTGDEVLLVWLPIIGPPVIERAPAASVSWKYSPGPGTSTLELATATRLLTIPSPRSVGLRYFESAAGEVFLALAERSAAAWRRAEAMRLLDRIPSGHRLAGRAETLRAELKAEEEVVAVYDGGHPDFSESCAGTLRLDADGIEFMSIAPESNVFVRIPYEQVVEFASPQRGALPADLQKWLGGKGLLTAGLGVAAAAVVPGGAMLVRSLSGVMGGDSAQGMPMNRVCIAASIGGTPYKIYLDVAGQTVGEMNLKAKSLWSSMARRRSRFLRPGVPLTAPAKPASSDSEVVTLLREIRDSLQLAAKANWLEAAGSGLVDSGTLSASQLEEVRASLRRDMLGLLGIRPQKPRGAQPPRSSLVIACPACAQKLRVTGPGVIKCPKCEASARVAEHLFQKEGSSSSPP